MTRRQSVNQTKLTVEFFLGWPTSQFYLLLNYFVRKWSSFIAYTKKLLHSISHNKHLGAELILPIIKLLYLMFYTIYRKQPVVTIHQIK